MNRLSDLKRFYLLLERLADRRGPQTMVTFSGHRSTRGVYFFFEPSELRSDTGSGPRVVRVGTHALIARSRSTLPQRLRQHAGAVSGGGNHRGSIFRLLIGQALMARGAVAQCPSWGVTRNTKLASVALDPVSFELRQRERPIEQTVTAYINRMPFVWIEIADEPGPDSLRGYIERNAIALLSNYERSGIDPPSRDWLGHSSGRLHVRGSGLWNQRHVTEGHEDGFLEKLDALIP